MSGSTAAAADDSFGGSLRYRANDKCAEALTGNWSGILAGAALEILQWSYDEWNSWTSAPYWWMNALAFVPWVGGYLSTVYYMVWIEPFRIDWTSLYANGTFGNIAMARNNANCTANVYAETTEVLKVDSVFASDADYYLNGIQASQQFYMALYNLTPGSFATLPILRWFTGFPLELLRWLGLLVMPIITILLQVDTESLKASKDLES